MAYTASVAARAIAAQHPGSMAAPCRRGVECGQQYLISSFSAAVTAPSSQLDHTHTHHTHNTMLWGRVAGERAAPHLAKLLDRQLLVRAKRTDTPQLLLCVALVHVQTAPDPPKQNLSYTWRTVPQNVGHQNFRRLSYSPRKHDPLSGASRCLKFSPFIFFLH